jgi:hypothetical protein
VFSTGPAFLHKGIEVHQAGASIIAARTSMSSRAGAAGSPGAAARRGCCRGGGGDQVGEGALPCGDALAGEHAQAEGERLGARVQGTSLDRDHRHASRR